VCIPEKRNCKMKRVEINKTKLHNLDITVENKFNLKQIHSWKPADVRRWLESIGAGIEKHAKAFESNQDHCVARLIGINRS
jgi:hypothetical protein